MRATAAWTVAVTLLVLPAAAACGSPAHPPHLAHPIDAAADSPPQAAVAATLGTSPRPGSPAFCGMLARSSALRALPGALTALSGLSWSGKSASAPTLTVRSAAADLSRIGPAAPARLRPDFGSAAGALTRLASQDQWSTTTLNAVSVSLARLGQGVEGPCGFPVG
jgi:hypothetical protein